MLTDLIGSVHTIVRTPFNYALNVADPPVIVLTYHRVTTLSSDPEMLAVTPANFRSHMRYLKDNHSLARFDEDWSTVSRPAVVVTFDDGYADNLLEALPIIEDIGVPATFFISTGTIDSPCEFWWHELERIILSGRKSPAEFTLRNGPDTRTWPAVSDSDRLRLYREIIELMKGEAPQRREDVLTQLRQWAQCDGDDTVTTHRTLTLEELRMLANNRWVTVGAHSVTHSRLSALSRSAQQEEITASKQQLEAWLGRSITVFSYPFGKRSDYTRETVALCQEAGFIKAAANFPGQAHRWTDPYRIPRLLVRNWPIDAFTRKLRRFWTR